MKLPVYATSSINRRARRTKQEMHGLREAICAVVSAHQPMTVRQVFYQLVSQDAIEKDEGEYHGVSRLLVQLRKAGAIPWSWVVDHTRWMRKPRTYSSLKEALELTQETYRRALWDNQESHVEIWLEKNALAGVLYPITSKWDVPLMVSVGFSSTTFLHEAAEDIADGGKPGYIYVLGDFDPSGVCISETIARQLREFAPKADIHVERVAVTAEQIKKFKLPLRPTKKKDSRAKQWKGGSVELDSLPPDALRGLVERLITQHVDARALEVIRLAEDEERRILDDLLYRMGPLK